MNNMEAGERLKKIRQEKGLSLEEVQKKTKIQMNILRAIEGESLTNLNPIYLKGFLKIYCNYLGVDPKEFISDYKENTTRPLSIPEVGENEVIRRPSFLNSVFDKLMSFRPDKKLIKIAFIIIAVLAAFFVLSKIVKFIASRPKSQAPVVISRKEEKPKEQSKEQAKQKVQASAVKPAAVEAKVPKAATGGISLVISAKESCLLMVKADGKVVMHRVLEKGRSDSWKAKEKIELDLGNAGAVDLIVNGSRFTKLGRKGQQIKGIVITEKDGLKIP
jgi:cytoskeletal protein RodZ